MSTKTSAKAGKMREQLLAAGWTSDEIGDVSAMRSCLLDKGWSSAEIQEFFVPPPAIPAGAILWQDTLKNPETGQPVGNAIQPGPNHPGNYVQPDAPASTAQSTCPRCGRPRSTSPCLCGFVFRS
jgi:hypothetical protein